MSILRKIMCFFGVHGWILIIDNNIIKDMIDGYATTRYTDIIITCKHCDKKKNAL